MKTLSIKIKQTCLFIGCCTIAMHASTNTTQEVTRQSQTVVIPLSEKVQAQNIDMPWRGLSKSSVQEQYGSPVNIHKAKGKPPISRWDYEQFSVYFESNSVIHSVMKQN